jgi:transcriptional regulator of acetoin/glycerol metabolism
MGDAPRAEIVTSSSRLARRAEPILDRTYDDLSDAPVALILADKEARIVARRVPAGPLRAHLDDARLSVGYDWSEQGAGTNALATALHSAAPIVVSGRDHVAHALANVAVAAAPVADPRTGQILGAAAVACAVTDSSVLMLPYACHIAHEVETQLVDHSLVAERALLEHFLRARRGARGGIVSVNDRTMFANAAAARFVGKADHQHLWVWANAQLAQCEHGPNELRLSNGTRLPAECETVRYGTETVGVIMRLRADVSSAPRRRPPRRGRRLHVGWDSLTAAQRGVAELVATGCTNHEAATRLFVSHHTIDFHLRQIFNKLGIRSRVELARIVAEHRADQTSAREGAA